MITDALIAILCTLLNGAFALLPEFTWSDVYDTAQYETLNPEYGGMAWPADIGGNSFSDNPMQSAIAMACRFNRFLPVYEGLYLMNLVFTFLVAFLLFRGVALMIGWIRGAGTGTGTGA